MVRRGLILALVGAVLGLWSAGLSEAGEKGKRKRPEGKVSPEKREEIKKRILERFDKNGNGQLDPAEREAAKAARGERGKGERKKKN